MSINYDIMPHLIRKILVNIKIVCLSEKKFFSLVDNMHKYTTEAISDNSIQRSNGRHRFTLRYYLNDESTTSVCYNSCCI
jgi:hypothetical protein